MSVSSPKYHIIAAESIDPEEDITLIVSTGLEENIYNQNIPDGGFPEWQPWEEGLIKIYPDLNDHIENKSNDEGNSKSITGNFVILRSSSKDNFSRDWVLLFVGRFFPEVSKTSSCPLSGSFTY